jgi:lysophospholipase L1-like esterase
MNTKKKIIFFLVLGGVLFLMTLALDRVLGLAIRNRSASPGLIFPPNSRYVYQTPEFTCEAINNSLGFRDREFTVNKQAKTRVLAIGDSFTFGWGVNSEQSWPKVLEGDLRALGVDVEIADLGQPGAAPDRYAEIAEKAVPLLKPDLIIVAITQGDDLAQLGQPAAKPEEARKPARPGVIARVLWRLYPHSLSIIEGRQQLKPLREAWQDDAQRLIDGLTPDEKGRLAKLDPQIQALLRDGQLNPSLMQTALKQPDYLMKTITLDRPETAGLIAQMAGALGRIKNVAEANGSRMIVISIPYGAYVSRKDFESRRRIGFELAPEVLNSTAPDDAIKSAADAAGVRFESVFAGMRSAGGNRNLYYELDGHFNPDGNKVFADLLAPVLAGLNKTP